MTPDCILEKACFDWIPAKNRGNDRREATGMTDMKRPPFRHPDKGPPSVILDVSNRESRVFPCRTFPSLTVRHHGSPHSEIILPLQRDMTPD